MLPANSSCGPPLNHIVSQRTTTFGKPIARQLGVARAAMRHEAHAPGREHPSRAGRTIARERIWSHT
jgi:hypothetical protein